MITPKLRPTGAVECPRDPKGSLGKENAHARTGRRLLPPLRTNWATGDQHGVAIQLVGAATVELVRVSVQLY